MASFTMQRTAVCAGGNHHTITLTAGARSVETMITVNDISEPPTDEELRLVVAFLCRTTKQLDNLTNAQLRNALIAGLTVTVSA